jgi:hypothetical protein
MILRVREKITLHFRGSRRPHGKARGGRIASYLTDEQRSQARWIGSLNCEIIFERARSNFFIKTFLLVVYSLIFQKYFR